MMSQPVARDKILGQIPTISRLREISASPGLAVGVLHRNEVVYTGHFGTNDLAGRKSDDETIYFIASLSKAMVGALVGIFVEEGLLEFTTRACTIIPGLEKALDGLGSKLTIIDLLSHRVGISRSDAFWLQGAGHELTPKSAVVDVYITQPAVRDFRTDFMYNNYGYCIVDIILEKLTGKSLEHNMQEKIFKPLGMTRSTMRAWTKDENYARFHMPLHDGTSIETPVSKITDETFNGACAAVRSCVKDLLTYYQSFMVAMNDQFKNETTSTNGSPFKQLLTVAKSHNQMDFISPFEQGYSLGLARAELPCKLGRINYNKSLVKRMPIIGDGVHSKLVMYHGGTLQGIGAAVYLLPETNTAIVSMQNSTGYCDACDWVPQLLIDTIFGAASPIDFVALALESAKTGRDLADNIERELQEGRKPNTHARDNIKYVGKYFDRSRSFFIDVKENNEQLSMSFQGLDLETYTLRHLHDDEFVWNESFNATARRGRFQTRPTSSYKIMFGVAGDGRIEFLDWKYDDYQKGPVRFLKEP